MYQTVTLPSYVTISRQNHDHILLMQVVFILKFLYFQFVFKPCGPSLKLIHYYAQYNF